MNGPDPVGQADPAPPGPSTDRPRHPVVELAPASHTPTDGASGAGAPTIDAVLFDFGHTLFAHAPGPEVLAHEAAALGHPLWPAEAAELWREIDAAAMDPAEVARGRDLDGEVWRTRWPVLYGLADRVVPGLGAAADRSFHDPWAWIPYQDTAGVLEALAADGVAVGVVSNTGWDVRTPFAVRGLDRWVTSFTLSYECGAAKPDPAIFHAACHALGTTPERTLMVGDDAIADRGAHDAGLAGLVLVDPTTPRAAPHHLDVVLGLIRG
jgi:HAD superfamily hydrolase (TIGR01509 family)